jgi:hypothetical protein
MFKKTCMKPNAITSCQSKRAYKDRDEAEEAATRLWLDHEVYLHTYKCQICEGWHFTSGEKK